MTSAAPATTKASRPAILFVVACVWVAVSLTAGQLAAVHVSAAYTDLVQQAVIAGLLFSGFYMMARAAVPDLRPLSSLGFVLRPGAKSEVGRGLALGWAVAIALVLPALVTGNLHLGLTLDAPSLALTLRSAVVLALFAVNLQMVLAGLPARFLLRTAGPGWTATATVVAVAIMVFLNAPQVGRTLLFSALAAAMFSAAFLRTRAAWVPIGIQVGWTLSLQLLFGAASPYTPSAPGVAQSQIDGPIGLTGGAFGPEASGFAVLILVAALIVLFRITRDYAWHYTYQPITAAGYPMDVAPPAEHLQEEQRAAAKAPLVQIAGIVPPPATALPPDSGS